MRKNEDKIKLTGVDQVFVYVATSLAGVIAGGVMHEITDGNPDATIFAAVLAMLVVGPQVYPLARASSYNYLNRNGNLSR